MKKYSAFFLMLLIIVLSQDVLAAPNLQQLIDATPANKELHLEAITYSGPVKITKPITIIGQKGTVITSASTGVSVKDATNISLQQLSFNTEGAPLTIDNVKNLELHLLDFSITTEGVKIQNSTHISLANILVEGFSQKHFSTKPNGIEMLQSQNINVSNVVVRNVQDAIYFERVENVDVHKTAADAGRYGLHFMYGKQISLKNNIVTNNVTGLMLMIVDGLQVENNTIKRQLMLNSNGLYLYDVQNSNISKNEFIENTVATVWNDVRTTSFEQNTFQSNSTVIEAEKSPTVEVRHNNFVGNILAARSDDEAFILHNNTFDDYSGYDFNEDGIGDTPHQTYTSFGQWMVRKPVYQYFMEAPSVVLLNKMDEQSAVTDSTLLQDEKPEMTTPTNYFAFNINWLQLLIGFMSIMIVTIIWRILR